MKSLLIYLFLIIQFTLLALYYNEIAFYFIVVFLLYRMITYSLVFSIIFVLITTIFVFYFKQSLIAPTITNRTFVVIKVNKFNYLIKNNQAKVILKTKKKLTKNTIIKTTKPFSRVVSLNNYNLFDYATYMITKKIYYEVIDNDVKIIKQEINNNKNNNVTNKINTYSDYFFFMNKENFDKKIYDTLIELSIIHLIVISGMHFNIIYNILNKILFFIKYNKIKIIIIFILLLYYLSMLSFTISASRAFLTIFIAKILKRYNFDKINVTAIVGIIILIINPLLILSFSYQLTFYLAIVLILIPTKLKENKLLLSFILYLCTIPFIAAMNYQISLFAFLYSVILFPVIIFTYIILIISLVFSPLNSLGNIYLNLFEKLILEINKYNVFLNTGYLPIVVSIIYIIILFFCIKYYKKKKTILAIPVFIISLHTITPSINGYVIFLNVGQGDCIIIKPPLSSSAMMIDVAKPYKQNTVDNIIIPFLKSMRIKEISKLVISHDDMDHSGGINDLLSKFKVKKVIKNKQEIINFNDYTFIDVLANFKSKDKNSNSITLFTRINGINFFFAGDIDIKSEDEIISKIEKMPIDILKIAHHGSKSSSSLPFLLLTRPKIGIVMSKLNNRYNHPNKEIVKRFNDMDIKMYNTATNNTIVIEYNFFRNIIRTYQ